MVRLLDVCKVYENGTPALSGINLKIDDGEFVFLVGSSASGKSTIVKILTSEVRMSSGRGMVNGYNLNRIKRSKVPELRRTIGVVFQDFRLIDKKTIYENVAFAMRAVGSSPRMIKKRVPYVLQLVGLDHKMNVYPNELSGGERQRVAVARAIVNNPTMIIADEPTGNLDPKMSVEIMSLLEKINELGTTVLVVTHEKELVNMFSKRVIAIDSGRIISDRTGGYYQNDRIGGLHRNETL
ncbi:MAG: cell division ATP-binding protein FtsE [Oscillospiraceae bacterium]|nr:cell division ATP-binding protein FtsE [Oscillospiraceae bacterium]MBQ6845932.1 cell division ATP-binding protein FtsE [Oscillospiraceae bacterium]MBQ7120124.1 cell division ATP-binding protein FtsE [Oscillospiraceae bacterium]